MSSTKPDTQTIVDGLEQTLTSPAFVFDGTGTFVEVLANERTEELLADDPAALVGETVEDVYAPTRASLFRSTIQRTIATGDVQECEYEMDVRAGVKHFRGHVSRLPGDDPERVIWIAEDVTERKDRTLELERHEAFLQQSRDLITVVDTDGVVQYDSPTITELHGYARGARHGDAVWSYVHPADRDVVREEFGGRLGHDTPVTSIEYRARNADGTWTWVESRGKLLRDVPSVDGLVVSTRDVGDRVQLDRELRRRRERLRDIEDVAKVGGWEFDLQTESLQCTEGLCRLFDVDGDHDPSLEQVVKFCHESDRDEYRTAIETCQRTGEPFDIEAQHVTAIGRHRWFHVIGNRVSKPDGEKIRAAVRDVTDTRERSQRLMVLNRILRHNMRNELNLIVGHAETLCDDFSELVDEDSQSDGEQFRADGESKPDRESFQSVSESSDGADSTTVRDVVDDAYDSANRIEEASNRLYSLAKKAKRFEEATENDNIAEAVGIGAIIEDVGSKYRDHRPDATVECDDGDVKIPGNAEAMRLLLDIAVENAIEHNDNDEPTVRISVARRNANHATIRVVDDGPGIPEFEREVLAEGTEDHLSHSSGLGLWTMNWLVTRFGGEVTIESNDPRGTVLEFVLPAVSASR